MQWYRANQAICFFADHTSDLAFLFGRINMNTALTVERYVLTKHYIEVMLDLQAYHGSICFEPVYPNMIYITVQR